MYAICVDLTAMATLAQRYRATKMNRLSVTTAYLRFCAQDPVTQ